MSDRSRIERLACMAILVAGALPAMAAETVVLDLVETRWRWTAARQQGLQAQDGEAPAITGQVPDGWTKAEYDDAAWPRTAGKWLDKLAFCTDGIDTDLRVPPMRTAQLCLRGKFSLADPGAAGTLRLSLKYRGGVVVYLNGAELARSDVPDGALGPGARATSYPAEAFLTAAGKPLPPLARVPPEDKDSRDRIASRDRALAPLVLPADKLRKGVNVLAVEVHRSDWPAEGVPQKGYYPGAWTPCALIGLQLTADGAGVAPANRRPAGLQIWNQDRNDHTAVGDFGDPCEPLRPVVIVAGRNGVFSGKVVVSSDAAIDGLKAQAGDLKQQAGSGVIPAAAVKVQYAEACQIGSRWVEPLSPTPPASAAPARGGGAVVPVWVAVRVPADAAPGEYRGTLAVTTSAGKAADVPLAVKVTAFTLPNPRQFRTFVGLYQSPTVLSLQYDTPEWSEKHWKLMERSFELLGQLGTQMVNIPLIDQTKFGNDDGMVYWVRKAGRAAMGPSAEYDYDLSNLDRYLKLVTTHLGVPRFVVVHLWQPGGWTASGPKQENTVTVLDKATGKTEHMQVPEFGTQASKAFWTPVLTKVKESLAKYGTEKSLCLGSLCETLPPPAVAGEFTAILGEVCWLRQTHAAHGALNREPPPLEGGGRIACHVYTYLADLPAPDKLPPLHKGYWPRVAYYRRAQGTAASLMAHRLLPHDALLRRLPGFAHVCLDYWPVKEGRKDRGGLLYGRWLRAGGNYPGDPEPAFLTWPGPDGAEPMASFEALREGLQEAEAMITISEAIEDHADRIGPGLAAKGRAALLDVLACCRERNQFRYQWTFYHVNHLGWQDTSQRLLDLAAEMQSRLRPGPGGK